MDRPFPAYKGDDPYIFVCYAHEDKEIVYPEIQWIHEQTVNIWYDEGISAGKNWRAEIGLSLERATRVLFYISEPSLKSDHCNREINFALDEGKEIVPVYLEDVALTPDLKIGLNRVQALHRESVSGDTYRSALLSALEPGLQVDAEVTSWPDTGKSNLRRNRRSLRLFLLFASVVVVVLIATLLVNSFSERPTSPSAVTIERLTANPVERSLTSMAISPDGRYLAYTTPRGLFLQVIANRETHEVEIDGEFSPTQVHWYPDGTRLLLLDNQPGSPSSLWSLSTFGGRPVNIVNNVSSVAVSPDGQHIAYIPEIDSQGRAHREVWRMGPGGEDPKRLLTSGVGDSVWNVAWSPDSARLAIGRWSRGKGSNTIRIETVDLSGGDPRTLLSDPSLFQNWTGVLPFTWCGESRFVFSKADDPQTSNLWVVDANPQGTQLIGAPKQLTRWVGSNIRGITASQDCQKLTTLLVRNQADVFVGELARGGTELLNEKKMTFDEREDHPLAWSNDSRELIVLSSRSGALALYRGAIDTDSLERITLDTIRGFSATWVPSGEWILYVNKGDIRKVPNQGGASIVVMSGAYRSIRCTSLSGLCVAGHVDEDDYVFTSFDPIDGISEELARTQYREPFTLWDLSPDGTQVAVVYNDDDEINLVSLVTGELSTISVSGWRNFEFVSWAANGEALFINAGFSMSGRYAVLLRVGLDGQTTLLRERPNEWHVFPQASPDGRYLAFGLMPFHGNAVLLQNF